MPVTGPRTERGRPVCSKPFGAHDWSCATYAQSLGTVYRLIEAAHRDGAAAAVAEQLHVGPLPGFGHGLYPDGDPRAQALLDLIPVPDELRATLDDLAAIAPTLPNNDFAVAALAHATGMGAGAVEVIFAIARTAGWIAHAIEEYAQPPHRFRWNSGYTGPTPSA